MPLTRIGGSAYDEADLSAVVRRAASLWRRGVRRFTVVIKGGIALDVDGEDADRLSDYVMSLPAFERPSAESAVPRTVIPSPGFVGHASPGEKRS